MMRQLPSSLIIAAIWQVTVVCDVWADRDTVLSRSEPLDQVQFKATHNSYQLDDPPSIQIDAYDVWEIELDFGIPFDNDDFVVGHDGPEPKYGLSALGDWVRDVLSANSLEMHPLILKLEAKTHGPCSSFRYPSFQCATNWGQGWQRRLADSLTFWLGSENWITPVRWREEFGSVWPPVGALAGQVIVTLQDSNDDRHIDPLSPHFFGREIPGLSAAWPPIKNAEEWKAAIEAGSNRLTLDQAYRDIQ